MRFQPIYDRQELAKKQNDYAVVIPVINEGERIRALLERMSALNIQGDFDVIIVDGGSTDGSLYLEHLTYHRVNTLLTRVSRGALGTQLQCAYDFVLERGYKGVITIDGNNKDDPKAIPRFKERLEAGVDFVQGSRFVKGGHHENTPLLRLFAVRFIHAPLLSIASGSRWTDTTQGFRAMSESFVCGIMRERGLEKLSDYSFLFYSTLFATRFSEKHEELGTRRVYPNSAELPSKIRGIKGSFQILVQLIKVVLGKSA